MPWATAAGLGLLASANFAPWTVPGAMILAVAGLFALLRAQQDPSRRQFAGLTATFGLALFGPGIWWMNAVSTPAWCALVLAQVAFLALLGALLREVITLRWWPLWVASVWTAVELLRGAVPFGGFPWLRLAHTALDTPFESYTRVVALVGTTWLMSLLAALLVVAVQHRARLAIVTVVAAPLLGLFLPVGIAGEGGTLTVAAVQGNTPGAFLTWPRGAILRLHAEETARIEQTVDLVLWPENASDIDMITDPHARSVVTEAARNVGAPILVGAILNGPTSDTAYNASVLVDANGVDADSVYVKQHIVPYGEYVPFRRQLGPLVPRFDRDIPRDLIAGSEPGAIHVADVIVGTVICWDVAYDDAIHGSVRAGAGFIAVQTSNASFADFGRGIQPEQQWDISRLRAIETGRWVVVASTNGVSGVIDPQGRVVERLGVKEAATAIQTISLATEVTWASRLQMPLSWLISVVALSAWVVGLLRRRRDPSWRPS